MAGFPWCCLSFCNYPSPSALSTKRFYLNRRCCDVVVFLFNQALLSFVIRHESALSARSLRWDGVSLVDCPIAVHKDET
jgi:hypothetical protein